MTTHVRSYMYCLMLENPIKPFTHIYQLTKCIMQPWSPSSNLMSEIPCCKKIESNTIKINILESNI